MGGWSRRNIIIARISKTLEDHLGQGRVAGERKMGACHFHNRPDDEEEDGGRI